MSRKICVVTGSRAEYGLLFWLMKEIQTDPDLTLQLVVSGMHLAEKFGATWREIEKDGFAIDASVDMELGDDTPTAIVRSMGKGMVGAAEAFERLRPDMVVVLGDRFEIFAAAQAAMLARIPIAHIHGGELTEGLIDEAIRHAVTKMAHLHFTSAEPYRRRVIQLGEDPDRVFNVGAVGLDNIFKLDLLGLDDLESRMDFALGNRFFLVTYHPLTLGNDDQGKAINQLMAALDMFPEYRVIITGVNADPGNSRIAQRIMEYAENNSGRVLLRQSLGQLNYLSAMKHCSAVIGNSSSGIIEAPAMKVPTINMGERQRGRIRAESVIDCGETSNDIAVAIKKAISPEFRATLPTIKNPHGDGGASRAIKNIIKNTKLENILMKRFNDLPVTR